MNKLLTVNEMCFSEDRPEVETLFKDYIAHYMSEVEGRKGYTYDTKRTFAEKDKAINNIMKKEVSRLSGVNLSDNSMPTEVLVSNPSVRWAMFATSNAMIDMVLPDLLIRENNLYTDTKVIAYGDTARFDVESNDLFFVSKAGRAQRTVEFQKQFTSTITINPENRMITVVVDLYKVLCGIESMAKYTAKVALSMEAEINRDTYIAFDTAMGQLPTTPADNSLQITGWDEDEAVKLATRVTAWNRGAKAIFVGTPIALRHIMPKDANYRYDLDSPYVRMGYIREFMDFGVLPLKQVADYKNPYKLALDDTKIYVISPALQKPVHLVLEGATRTNVMDHYMNADLTSTNTLYKAWGVGIGYNGIAGLINLE